MPDIDTETMARERVRTLLAEALVEACDVTVSHEGLLVDVVDVPSAADALLALFLCAHFEYATNVAGVRVRRITLVGQWEVDPEWVGR